MPLMRIVDLRRNGEKKGLLDFSEKLSQAIAVRLEKREQTIYFLNRADFRPPCSAVIVARRAIARTAASRSRSIATCTIELPPLRTHRDGAEKCPECVRRAHLRRLRHEKVESTVSHLFPKAMCDEWMPTR